MAYVKLKLVTIIAETVLEESLCREILELGATGYTVTETHGRGTKGIRTGQVPGESVRIEALVSQEAADAIVAHLRERYFEDYAVIAWLEEVEAVRGSKYA